MNEILTALLSPSFEPFNTREAASTIWLLVFTAWQAKRKEVRTGIANVLNAALHWKLVMICLASLAWTLLGTVLLWKVGFWKPFLLKDTILWAALSGLWLSLRSVKVPDVSHHFRDIAKDALSFLVCFQFLVNAYTFNFWIELLLLIPFLTTVAGFAAVAGHALEFAKIRPLIGCVQGIAGAALIVWVVFSLCKDIRKVVSNSGVRQFALPVILTAFALPLSYAVALLSGYEQLFLRLKIGRTRSFALRLYGMLKLIDHFRLNLKHVLQSLQRLAIPLLTVSSHDEVDALIRNDRHVLNQDRTSSQEVLDNL